MLRNLEREPTPVLLQYIRSEIAALEFPAASCICRGGYVDDTWILELDVATFSFLSEIHICE